VSDVLKYYIAMKDIISHYLTKVKTPVFYFSNMIYLRTTQDIKQKRTNVPRETFKLSEAFFDRFQKSITQKE